MSPAPEVAGARSAERFVRLVAVGVGLVFVGAGVWAFVAPRSFFENAAAFEPYNAHFVRDIGAFQLGLGAVLLLGVWVRDALFAALAGVAVGAVAHLVAHIVDRHAGGQPVVDIPAFGLVAGLLVAAAIVRARLVRA
jgi:uncharacterized protein YjeT (DUF2065 family)